MFIREGGGGEVRAPWGEGEGAEGEREGERWREGREGGKGEGGGRARK